MEFIKKKILRKTKIDTVVSPTGNTNQIIPDLSANYLIIINITAEVRDLGVFDSGDKFMVVNI